MIIGIIPNKNDSWILEANLKILSKLCDHVIIGLDNCIDDSISVIKKYHNAVIIENFNSELAPNNQNRRQALLNNARELSINPVIIAVDADEVFSQEILKNKNLEIIKNLDFGVVLEVKFRELWFSSTLYRSENKSIWAGRLMPCIWRDNGVDYPYNNWHEVRVPEIKKNRLFNVELIHFARTQPIKYCSRMRYYIARDVYVNKKNPIKSNFHYAITHSEQDMVLSSVKPEWFPFLDNEFFVNIQKKDSHVNWFNDEVLDYLLKDNSFSLKLADIWDFDWIEYYKIRKNKEPDRITLDKLQDKRSNKDKKIAYYIRMNSSYPFYSIYLYFQFITNFLIMLKIYNLTRKIYLKLKKFIN